MQLCPLRGLREQRKSVSTSTLQGVSSCYFSPDLEDERKQSEAFFSTDMFPMCAKGRIDLRRDLDFRDFAKLNCVETRMRLDFRNVRSGGNAEIPNLQLAPFVVATNGLLRKATTFASSTRCSRLRLCNVGDRLLLANGSDEGLFLPITTTPRSIQQTEFPRKTNNLKLM